MAELYCMPDGKSIEPFKTAEDIELPMWKREYDIPLIQQKIVIFMPTKALSSKFKKTGLAREIEASSILFQIFTAYCLGVPISSKVQHLALHGKGRTKKKNINRINSYVKRAKKINIKEMQNNED